MSAEFDLDGFILLFEISGWKPSDRSNWDVNWCMINIRVTSSFMDYKIHSESLLSCEIEELIKALENVLNGKEAKKMECLEPDLEFHFNTRSQNVESSSDMDFVINFWDEGALTANSLHLCFSEKDMERLLDYLKAVVKVSDR